MKQTKTIVKTITLEHLAVAPPKKKPHRLELLDLSPHKRKFELPALHPLILMGPAIANRRKIKACAVCGKVYPGTKDCRSYGVWVTKASA